METKMINPLTLTPCTFSEFIDYLSKCSDIERAEIERLFGQTNINYLERVDPETATAIDPDTFKVISLKELKERKEKDPNYLVDDKFIYAVFMYDSKYSYGPNQEAISSIETIKAKAIYPKDDNRYGAYKNRPFEDCFILSGVSMNFIDNLCDEAKAFLTNFAVIQNSGSYFDCYDLVVFFNHKDPDGIPYINNLRFHV